MPYRLFWQSNNVRVHNDHPPPICRQVCFNDLSIPLAVWQNSLGLVVEASRRERNHMVIAQGVAGWGRERGGRRHLSLIEPLVPVQRLAE